MRLGLIAGVWPPRVPRKVNKIREKESSYNPHFNPTKPAHRYTSSTYER